MSNKVTLDIDVNGAPKAAAALQSIASQITGTTRALLALAGVGSVGYVLNGAIKQGLRFNAVLQDATLGIAAIQKQFNPERFKNFNDAMRASASAVELLREKAVRSPASFQELVTAFQGITGAATSANIAIQDQINLVVLMSQALAGLGIRSEQILQESRALLTGNINENALAARILGITRADIERAKEAGQLYEFLTGKLKAFAEAGEVGARNYTTAFSNLRDVIEQKLARATETVFRNLTAGVLNLTEALNRSDLAASIDGFVGVAVDHWNAGEFDKFIGLSIQAGFEIGKQGVDDLIRHVAQSINNGSLGRTLRTGAWVLAGQVAQQSLEGVKQATRLLALPVSLNDPATDKLINDFFNNWKSGVQEVAAEYAGIRTASEAAMPAAKALFDLIERKQKERDAAAGPGTSLPAITVSARRIQGITDQQLTDTILLAQQARAIIEGSFRLTDVEKYRQRVDLLKVERDLIAQRLHLLRQQQRENPDDQQLGSRIDTTSAQLAGANTAIATIGPDPASWGQQFRATFTTLQNEWGTWAQQMAGTFGTVFNGAISSISSGISGLILGTQTWGQALMNIGTSIATTIVQAFVQMGVRYIATRILMWTVGRSLDAAGLAANLATAKAYAAVWASAATLSTIGSYGASALAAPGLIAAAQGIVAGTALLGFAEGGFTGPGRNSDVAGVVHANEYVMPASAVQRHGIGFFDALKEGDGPAAPGGASTQFVFYPESRYEELLRSGQLDDGIVHRINANRHRIGIRS